MTHSLVKHLNSDLDKIQDMFIEYLDLSSIYYLNLSTDYVAVLAPDYHWKENTPEATQVQMRLLEAYSRWHEKVDFLFRKAPSEPKRVLAEVHGFYLSWIDKNTGWGTPKTIQEAKKMLLDNVKKTRELLSLYASGSDKPPILVPDTNSLIFSPDPSSYFDLVDNAPFTLLVVPTVTSELDKLKIHHRDKEFRSKVKALINRIKGYRNQGPLLDGVKVNKTITLRMVAVEPNMKEALSWLDPDNDDDRLIASLLEVQRAHPDTSVYLVTDDINLQNKAEMASLPYFEPPVTDEE